MDYSTKTISELAAIIEQNWKEVNKGKIYFGAVPYLDAMKYCRTLESPYGVEDCRTQVIYFLSNANQWKGEVAREVKKELNKRLKSA